MGEYKPTTEDNKCIFCDIVAKNDPEVIFWQDDMHVAFLSIDPNTLGFSLVVPKMHHASDILKMDDVSLQVFILAGKRVARILEDFYEDVGRVGLIMEGTGIKHAHLKLIPMHGTDYMKKGEWRQCLSGVEHWFNKYEGWISSAGGPMADRSELAKLVKQLRDSQQ